MLPAGTATIDVGLTACDGHWLAAESAILLEICMGRFFDLDIALSGCFLGETAFRLRSPTFGNYKFAIRQLRLTTYLSHLE